MKESARIAGLEQSLAMTTAELDRVRRLLAPSNAPCAYCGEAADRIAECRQGAGCERAFDLAQGFLPPQPGDVPLKPGPTIDQLKAENDRLRHLLASSDAPCPYCGLPSDRMNECAHGFPGCGRADDLALHLPPGPAP